MRSAAFALLLLGLTATATHAERFEVKMLNRNATGGMVYEPEYLRIQPGDTVKFIATDVTHNAASIPGMLPAGAVPFKGQINQEIEVIFELPGSYGIRCIPHWAMGMVMLVEVGDQSSDRLTLPPSLPPEAGKRFDEILKRRGEN